MSVNERKKITPITHMHFGKSLLALTVIGFFTVTVVFAILPFASRMTKALVVHWSTTGQVTKESA